MTWHQSEDNRGVRWRLHPSRKHGLHKDRYFQIRFSKDGRRIEEALGWASDGWTLSKAVSQLEELRENVVRGEGPQSLKEKRAIENKRRDREKVRKTTFGQVFKKYVEATDKDTERAQQLYDNWLEKSIGNVLLSEVCEIHLYGIRKQMLKSKRAPATIKHALGTIRQVFNYAKSSKVFSGENPIKKGTMPKLDNARMRYLSPDEIQTLLAALLKRSPQVHDEALLAVHTGMRFGEIAALTWQDVNFETGSLTIRGAKAGSRTAFMNDAVTALLKRRQEISGRGLVFPNQNGGVQGQPSKTFILVADDLFNVDQKDRRLRVTFHTLRHSFGSLLYQKCGDIYLTGQALGHRTLAMAMRYAKGSEPKLRDAFRTMGEVVAEGKQAKPALSLVSGGMKKKATK